MTVKELMETNVFKVLQAEGNDEQWISKPFCCDLLSIAMSKAPAGCAWVTIMGNVNTLAVASLTEVACIILAEGVVIDDDTLVKAKEQSIIILSTDFPIFEAAMKVEELKRNAASI